MLKSTHGPHQTIYCTGCQTDVQAVLTNGAQRYPHRPDLATIPFWQCPTCKNYVGCHHSTDDPLRPLGVIATPELVEARKAIHKVLDPLWQTKKIARGRAYNHISSLLGHTYHTAEIRSLQEARIVYRVVCELHNSLVKQEARK